MRPGFAPAYAPLEPEPLPQGDNGNSRIFAFVDDLFFQAKIQETARKLNVKVEFVKTEKDLLDHMKQNGEEKPSLIIFDMNNANAKPLTLIPKLKTKLKKGTSIIGFLSHVQGDLKMKAHEVGCDMVLPRSAFSQNLPQLLRRHGAPEPEATNYSERHFDAEPTGAPFISRFREMMGIHRQSAIREVSGVVRPTHFAKREMKGRSCLQFPSPGATSDFFRPADAHAGGTPTGRRPAPHSTPCGSRFRCRAGGQSGRRPDGTGR